MKSNIKLISKVILIITFLASFLLINAQTPESEPNDTFGIADDIDISTGNLDVTGAISPVGDQDKFRFTITAPRYITFETFDSTGSGCAGGIDTVIKLYNSSQTLVSFNDDDGINSCSKLESGLFLPGTYYIHVEEFNNDNIIPAYLLRLSLVPQITEIEPNDNFTDANNSALQVTSTVDIVGNVSFDNSDYFKITLTTPSHVRFRRHANSNICSPGALETATLYDSNQTFLRFVTGGCSFEAVRLPPNTYYLKVASGLSTPYVMRILIEPTSYVDELESNNTFTQANLSSIQVNSSLNVFAAITPIGDIDKFRVNLAQDSSVKFETFDGTGLGCSTAAPKVDTLIRVFDSSGTQIFFNDDSGINFCSLLNLNLTAGIYYIQVEEFLNDELIPAYVLATTITPNTRTLFDYDGDRKSDVSIFRPNVGEWWYLKSSDGGNFAVQFGQSTDKLVPADYTGDGKTDIAFWRPSSGEWFILRSEDSSFYAFPFGTLGDIPAPADYDGDGKADATVFRPAIATWFISKSTGGTEIIGFGSSSDKPAIADYDGDGKADIAIWRPSVGEWWYRQSSDAQTVALQFGIPSDKPMPGDYTGDGKADIAFFRPSTGFWFVLRSEDSSFFAFPFGASGDVPVSGDYDGDGKFDAAVFRPSTRTWFLNRSTAGVEILSFGIAGDQPVPNTFVP